MEATQESISRSNVVYTYNGILFSLKKAGNADTGYLEDTMLSEVSHTQKTRYSINSSSLMYLEFLKFIKTESRMVVAKG